MNKKVLNGCFNRKYQPHSLVLVIKLLGFDYSIEYKSGQKNVVVDALSRVQGNEVLYMAISVLDSDLLHLIKNSYLLDNNNKAILDSLGNGILVVNYSLQDGVLKEQGKSVVGPDKELKRKIIQWQHEGVEGGHSSRDITLRRVKNLFYCKGMTKIVTQHIKNCVVCQALKNENVANPGLLQPLPIPSEVWVDISIDFITGLPKSNGKEVIFVVVDSLNMLIL